MAGSRLGLDCKLYRNTASHASPSWVEVTNVKDLELQMEKGEADVTTRAANGWELMRGTLKKGSIDFDMVWDPTDGGFAAILAAWLANSTIEMLVLDGPITTPGSQGLRAYMDVLKCARSEKLTEAVMASVSLKPTYDSTGAPSWYTAS